MMKNILNTIWTYIKKFAELEKTGPYGKASSFDPTLAKIKLIVLIALMVLAFLCWLTTGLGSSGFEV